MTAGRGATVVVIPDPGGEAFVDADWIAAAGGRTPPLLRHERGRLVGDWTPVELAVEPDQVVELAAGVLLAVADEAAAIVAERSGAGSVRVLGAGLVAEQARRLVGRVGRGRPVAVIDALGSAESFATAAALVADGGLVVLAGAPGGALARVDLYADVHLRGVRVVGAGLPLDHARVSPAAAVSPATVVSGRPLPAAAWYRVRAARP